jgi:hypothetical protein
MHRIDPTTHRNPPELLEIIHPTGPNDPPPPHSAPCRWHLPLPSPVNQSQQPDPTPQNTYPNRSHRSAAPLENALGDRIQLLDTLCNCRIPYVTALWKVVHRGRGVDAASRRGGEFAVDITSTPQDGSRVECSLGVTPGVV